MTTQKKYHVDGMHCASCAGIIEKTLNTTTGVTKAEVNYGTEDLSVTFNELEISEKNISEKIEPLGYSLINTEQKINIKENDGENTIKNKKILELKKMKSQVISTIPMVLIAVFTMVWDMLEISKLYNGLTDFLHHVLPLLATYVLFVIGKPYLRGVMRFIKYGKANMDTLIGIGTFTAYFYSFIISAFENILSPYLNTSHSYYDVTIVVISFIALGKFLELSSKMKTGDAIEKLVGLQSKTALVVRDGKEIEININQVIHGDFIIIKPGSKIPVDGIVNEGSSFVDESMISGEPMAVKKNIGDNVIAGTINTNGSFIMKTTKIGAETLLSQIIKMVENAQGSKAPIQALADKISAIFVPIVLGISVVSLGSWLLFGSAPLGFSEALSMGVVSFVSVLIIACPCALGLATPTAMIVGIGKGAKEGILIKDATSLETLHKVDTLIVDKTGTLTIGKPTLTTIHNLSKKSDSEFLSILAGLESKSEHPIAEAILQYVSEKNISILSPQNFEAIQGKGISARINGKNYLAGNTRLLEDKGLHFDTQLLEKYTLEGKTPVVLATDTEVLGFVMVADEIKKDAKQVVKKLQDNGVHVIMITGDNERTAQYVAKNLGINQVYAQALPQDKLHHITVLQEKGHLVAMAGDGVNDAPALAQADVGIAMGTGTDVAIESAGITLLGGDISKIFKAIKLSKITMSGVKQNLFWAFIYNTVGIPLAAGLFYPIFGWVLNPIFAGIAMALSSVSVVLNSLRIKTKKI